jgi:hypothetical protein
VRVEIGLIQFNHGLRNTPGGGSVEGNHRLKIETHAVAAQDVSPGLTMRGFGIQEVPSISKIKPSYCAYIVLSLND